MIKYNIFLTCYIKLDSDPCDAAINRRICIEHKLCFAFQELLIYALN